MNPAGLNEAPLTMDTTVRECQSGLQGGGKGDDGKAATGGARYGGPGAPPPLSLSLSVCGEAALAGSEYGRWGPVPPALYHGDRVFSTRPSQPSGKRPSIAEACRKNLT